MPFVNKEIDIGEFMKQLRRRLEKSGDIAALSFYEFFLEEQLPEELKRRVAADCDGRTVIAGDFDVIYPMAAELLRNAAARNFSEVHSEIYNEANAVSIAFCDELNEFFQCSGDEKFDPIHIKSFVQTMVDAGLVKVAPWRNDVID
ncbi:hypothetical protein JW977_02030 [Candidatus Falkowbacteria bacterium]|nr:hypothetical protein [Candidatus Falkowbacteria bacterium]